ncbi:MAG: TolC family protein [Bryobacteraceae bacterium]|nr:TolC family protein [Bryobacteraceae bacterium]
MICPLCFVLLAGAEPLSVREAITLALERNPEIVAERASQEAATGALFAAQGAFDPVLGLRFGRRNATTPASSILQGANGRLDERTSTQETSFRQRLPWLGMSLLSQLETNRVSTSNPFTSLNPYYATLWRDTLLVPLWRGRRTDEARTTLKVRRANHRAAGHDFEARVLDLASRVEASYWTWVAALEGEAAAADAVRYAREALASTERLVNAGEQADSELAGARGQLRRGEEQAAQASGAAREAEQQLKSWLARDGRDAVWERVWRPVETKLALEAQSASELTARALAKRPDLAAALARLDAEKANSQLAEEGRKPAVNLSFSRTVQGLAGRSVPQGALFPGFTLDAPPQLVGGAGRAFDQLLRNRYATLEASLTVELPWRNREAEGRYRQQVAQERRVEAQTRQLEVQAALEVRRAWASYAAAQARISAASDAESASRERLESELRLYREGQSNNLSLNVRQSERTVSLQALVEARRAANLASAELRRAAALTLETFSITVE